MPALNLEREIGRRVARRTRCDLVVDIRDGARTMRALLSDFSTSGFRLAHLRGELAGASLWLCPEGMEPLAAKVRWSDGEAMGCQFLYPLSDAVDAKMRALAAVAQPATRSARPRAIAAAV